ncbi:MAG TPA: ribosome biogenesis GTPase Der [Cryomorphaceae bacterium]|jgi:GTP-binding protein|nr:ribosome biogenesis GTPase Der [Schleiferiaceae bacterium]HAK70290.1 ribosome biogenesis GTPase Der [Cryomorphaceae bacterium]HCY24808.1 ribosome biogenesis GTPase Der [Cryomorphaceae bacterium]|tara:strand:- start:778 stop:2082 length:1305 start_codon:yes stop_codon:yes gene_type:complete
MSNIVAIVGRPNVGKSTIFNRLVQRRDAIVDSVAGVTRDRHYGKSDWNGKEFSVIDTGGYITGSDDIFESEIRNQVELALDEASVVLFVLDLQAGLTDFDKIIADLLRKTDKPVVYTVNKVDNAMLELEATEFYGLGIEKYHTISAVSGAGTGDLLDELAGHMDENPVDDFEGLPKMAIVGRPNAGKSSIVNALFDEERNIVTAIPGTTRDTVNTRFNKFGFDFMLLDTAGLRKKGKVHENLEFYSNMRSVRAIEHADVCMLVVDATRGFEAQDLSIVSLVEKNKKGLVVVVNKWDIAAKDTNTIRDAEDHIRKKLEPFTDFPIVFTSALTKQRVLKAFEEGVKVYDRRRQKISTSKLNDTMLDIIKGFPPPAVKGKFVKIKFCTQLPTYTPQFAFFANLPQYVKEPYKRFLENKMRQAFDFHGAPIEIFFRKK